MDNHDALSLVLRNLREQQNTLQEEMAKGCCKTFEEYKHMAGKMEGISVAEREILDMIERIEIS